MKIWEQWQREWEEHDRKNLETKKNQGYNSPINII